MELSPRKTVEIKLGDGHTLNAVAQRTVKLRMKVGYRKFQNCKLQDVLYVPALTYNLVSVSKVTDRGNTMKFSETNCVIRDAHRKPVAIASRVDGFHQVVTDSVCVNTAKTVTKEDLWHRRYGHLSVKNLQRLARDNMMKGINNSASRELQFCESCLEGKQRRSTFPSHSENRAEESLEIIHCDVRGKLNAKSLSGA